MRICQWSDNGLCQVFRVKGSDTKPSCDGLKDRKCLGNYNLEDIRDRRGTTIIERSEPVEQNISMSLAKKVTITAKLDLSTGATDYELKLTINAKPEDMQRLIQMLQAEAPVELKFYSPQLALDEVSSHA